jgi:AcrR family transcriptional regulator
MKKRKYRLGRRAGLKDRTRRRIVEATVALHQELGPRATTISAIAEQAGVQRLTVYRHFPDDAALFRACSSHWLAEHPMPDPAVWRAMPDWRTRCRAAFASLYTYYRRNAGMLASVMRDADLPAMREPIAGFAAYDRQLQREILESAGPSLAADKAFRTTIMHALAFATWQSLAQCLKDEEMVALSMAWLEGIADRKG